MVYLFWITTILIFLYPYRKVISMKLRIFSCIKKIEVYCKAPPFFKKKKNPPNSIVLLILFLQILCIFDEKNGLHYGSFITFLPSSHMRPSPFWGRTNCIFEIPSRKVQSLVIKRVKKTNR